MRQFKTIELNRKYRKILCQLTLAIFIILNVLSYCGAYGMTHFLPAGHWKLGISRPINTKLPTDVGLQYKTQSLWISPTEWLETWFVPATNSQTKGTIFLFPGAGSSKASQLLPPAQVFHDLGYDALLVDFRGVGGSSGNTTTIGAREAKDVAVVMSYARRSHLQRPWILYGISMGSAAVLKATAHEKITPDAIILELPFARLIDAVRSRLKAAGVPTFPMAELLVFWGGVQHGFNGFTHNPVTYATKVICPTLIMHGKLDKWTTMAEIEQILRNLSILKELVIFPQAGHDLLVTIDREYWKKSVDRFLQQIENI